MQYISRLILVVSLLLAAQATVAQPPARQKDNANKPGKAKNTTAVTGLSERAKSQYPGTITPQEVEWKRDIYRELDLSKEKNASLYYPVEPMGESMNLFTFLFGNSRYEKNYSHNCVHSYCCNAERTDSEKRKIRIH